MLREYLQNGGFPEFQKYGRPILSSIYNDVVTKDIVQRHGIKHIEALKRIAFHLISNSSHEFTYSSLRGITRSRSQITMVNWVKYMEEAYLIFTVERFSFKLKERALAPRKVYAVDTGIVNLLGFRSDSNIARLMETAVAIELKRRSARPERPGMHEIYYWKDHSQREVDFVIKEGKKVRQLIQVTYASGRGEVSDRETENLIRAGAELGCKNLSVITLDYEGTEKIGGMRVQFIPIWKWLLE